MNIFGRKLWETCWYFLLHVSILNIKFDITTVNIHDSKIAHEIWSVDLLLSLVDEGDADMIFVE